MESVDRLSEDTIARFLADRGVQFRRSEHGAFVVSYERAEIGCRFDITVFVEGDGEMVFGLESASPLLVPRARLGEAMIACNRWNSGRRHVVAWLDVDATNPEREASFRVSARAHFDGGVRRSQFDAHASRLMISASEFWEWLRNDQSF